MESQAMTATALILTCERDHKHAERLVRGIEKYWPGLIPLVMRDSDKSTETDIPGDVRDVVRRVPYLRRVFDAWAIIPTEDVYILDSDCLIYSQPTDFGVPAYQGVVENTDDPAGVRIWKDLGVDMPIIRPRFVGGMFSARRDMWRSNLDLAIAYVRECVSRGFDRAKYPGVVCEQSLLAGLWRKTYPDCPLDPERYAINRMTANPVIFHISSGKHSKFMPDLIADYEARYLG